MMGIEHMAKVATTSSPMGDPNCGWPGCGCSYGCMGRAIGHPYDAEVYAAHLEAMKNGDGLQRQRERALAMQNAYPYEPEPPPLDLAFALETDRRYRIMWQRFWLPIVAWTFVGGLCMGAALALLFR